MIAAKDRRIAELEKIVTKENELARSAQPKAKKKATLSREKQESMLQRLTRHKKEPELPPIPGFVQKSIDADTVSQMVSRLAEADLEVRKTKQDELVETLRQPLKSATKPCTLDPDELAASANRLSQTKHAKDNIEKLREERLSPTMVAKRVVDKAAIQDCTGRLYEKTLERKKETMEKIIKTYVESTAPKSTGKLSKEKQKAMADRLSTRG